MFSKKDWTQVSCIAEGFFAIWAAGKPHRLYRKTIFILFCFYINKASFKNYIREI